MIAYFGFAVTCFIFATTATGAWIIQLAYVGFQHLIGHAKSNAGIKLLIIEKEAVRAVEVANGTRGLSQDEKAWGRFSFLDSCPQD